MCVCVCVCVIKISGKGCKGGSSLNKERNITTQPIAYPFNLF